MVCQKNSGRPALRKNTEEVRNMIPKKIHYCWFGGNPKPKLAEKRFRSWKKYCPGYEIIQWIGDFLREQYQPAE